MDRRRKKKQLFLNFPFTVLLDRMFLSDVIQQCQIIWGYHNVYTAPRSFEILEKMIKLIICTILHFNNSTSKESTLLIKISIWTNNRSKIP